MLAALPELGRRGKSRLGELLIEGRGSCGWSVLVGQPGAAQGVRRESGSAQAQRVPGTSIDIGVVPVEVTMTNPGWH